MFGVDLMGICGIKMTSPGSFLNSFYNFGVVVALAEYTGVMIFYQLTKGKVKQILAVRQRDEERINCENTKPMLQMIKWVVLVPLMFIIPSQTVAFAMRLDSILVFMPIRRLLTSFYPLSMISDPCVTIKYIRVYRVMLAKLAMRADVTSTIFSHVLGRNPQSLVDHTNAPVVVFINQSHVN